MKVICCSSVLAIIASTLVGCGDAGRLVNPASTDARPSGQLSPQPSADASLSASAGKKKPSTRHDAIKVDMLDRCDSATFNAALGPGTCTRPRGMTFQAFIDELTATKSVRAWRFVPSRFEAELGDSVVAINRGGEVHTFTNVANFGGGIVPMLNQLSGLPDVAPECAALEEDDFVPPGGKYFEEAFATPGIARFQCCIHPWMRAVAKVEKKEKEHRDDHDDHHDHDGHHHR
jgi:plastocyanin